MAVSRELIEKYHAGECSPEERKQVEEWLLSDYSDERLLLPPGEDKETHRQEMWNEITAGLPEEDAVIFHRPAGFLSPVLQKGIAALLLLGLSITLYVFLGNMRSDNDQPVSFSNSGTSLKALELKDYRIILAPNSKVNYQSGLIDFKGSILISPKQDIELTLQSDYEDASDRLEKVEFKMGQTYIAFISSSDDYKVIVLNRKNLIHLPDVLQKQINSQFSTSSVISI